MQKFTHTVIAVFLSASGICAAETATKVTRAYHLQIIDALTKSDAVIPWHPDHHPVSMVGNREAIIPPQCYTKTDAKYNPCYVCHQNTLPKHSNRMNDGGLQLAYSFSDVGMNNAWENLFEDRSEAVLTISDDAITNWVNTDNYSELSSRLLNANHKGWIPDLANLQSQASAFDAQGFAKDNSHWVAFNYKPMPSTFWPTNGSTDDVMVRLPAPFRENNKGEYQRDIYTANLAILEATIKGLTTVTTPPIDERIVGTDLNNDGHLTNVQLVHQQNQYVGAANKAYLAPYIFPKGTEFLHSVRYLSVDKNTAVGMATRMKELRYMKKWDVFAQAEMAQKFYEEELEKDAGNLPGYYNLQQHGLDNGMGWAVQGFIEGANGLLRANTYEENLFCMGCHGSIGTTIDHTFSFARKMDGVKGWGYINLKGMPDAPNVKGDGAEKNGEIATYLQRVGGGSEFRNNDEMLKRWFKADGTIDSKKIAAAPDVYSLIVPSRKRALMLNKAYRSIVASQDFIFGRDATVRAPSNVHQTIDNKTSLTLPIEKFYEWDIRLAWPTNIQQ